MVEDIKYVKDIHGHVYIYVDAYHADRIGNGLEFTEFLVPDKGPVALRERAPRTLVELREAAMRKGLDIPDETPFAKAQNMYAEFLENIKKMSKGSGASEVDTSGLGVFDDVSKALS
jgi:hypothetical protein